MSDIRRFDWDGLLDPNGDLVMHREHLADKAAAVAEAEQRVEQRVALGLAWGAENYAKGYAAGLQEARDAVKAVQWWTADGHLVWRADVFAAIDALRDRAIAAELTRDGQDMA